MEQHYDKNNYHQCLLFLKEGFSSLRNKTSSGTSSSGLRRQIRRFIMTLPPSTPVDLCHGGSTGLTGHLTSSSSPSSQGIGDSLPRRLPLSIWEGSVHLSLQPVPRVWDERNLDFLRNTLIPTFRSLVVSCRRSV